MHRAIAFVFLVLSAALWCQAEDAKREEKVEIRVVSYARSESSKKENRLLVVGQTAYRTVEELKQFIGDVSGHPEIHFVLYGTCFASNPRLTEEEIGEIKAACAKAGLRFTYYPGG